MESTQAINLNYTEEFRIACTINNIRFEIVLQNFIDQVSFYVFSGGEAGALSKWATKVMADFIVKFNSKPSPHLHTEVQAISTRYKRQLKSIIDNKQISTESKFSAGMMVMEDWSAEIPPSADYPAEALLNQHFVLSFPFNFRILSMMNGTDTEQVLQYFIDNVSLAEDRAMNLYQVEVVNPSTCVLLLMLVKDEKSKRKPLPQEHIYVKYALRLLDLDEEMEKETDAEYRLVMYKIFYAEWYNALRVTIN
ncbi:hypothetical protein ACSBL2_03500 [Pedobacter sp. AW31-3R]|uniref:hypothetical protein n=1 Tax=Pedobacter sp. AW31-3R TaxID=3445781 RepID=UPI003FA17E99